MRLGRFLHGYIFGCYAGPNLVGGHQPDQYIPMLEVGIWVRGPVLPYATSL
jgi:hypothetical protein